MFPDPIDNRARKKGILGRGHPGSQRFPDVLVRLVLLVTAIQELGNHLLFRLGVNDLTLFRVIVLVFIVVVNLFDLDAGEKRCKTIEVILRPLLPGMIVALGALDPSPKENLADVGGVIRGIRIERDVPEAAYAVQMRPLAEEQLGDHLVVWLVTKKGGPQILVDVPGSLVAGLTSASAEQFGVFERPDLGKLWPSEKRIDQLRALLRIR